MRVKIEFSIDIDPVAYRERYQASERAAMTPAYIRDDVKGIAAAAVVQHFDGLGVLTGAHVKEWEEG